MARAEPPSARNCSSLLATLKENAPAFHDAEESLNKLVELNVGYGNDAVKHADEASAKAR
jgi:methyl-accepting chemotaxis protein